MSDGRQIPLVLGAEGTIGRAVAEAMEGAYPETVSAGRAEIDVTDRPRLEAEVERLRPTVIVNCAAVADPAACEADPESAARVNAEGAANAARAAAAIGARLVQFSSAAVFDGIALRPYRESDATAPASVLGRTRLEGERLAVRHEADCLIVRTSWPYGGGGTSLVETIRRRIRQGGVVEVAGDRTGSPTLAGDLGAALLRLLRSGHRGVVHFGNGGCCSLYHLAAAILAHDGGAGATLRSIASPGGRTVNEAVDTSRYTELTGHVPRGWRRALQSHLRGEAGGSREVG
jgi:dTDP-4-dehydrorhamnose reductase